MKTMPYSLNPYLPKVRAQAVNCVRISGWSVRQTARYLGVSPGAVSKWLQRIPDDATIVRSIPTKSSRPRTSPGAVGQDVTDHIRQIRLERGRCAEAIWYQLKREGIMVSVSTVQRTLKRKGLIRTRSPWKKIHQSGVRPVALSPGTLVEIDSVHFWTKAPRVYLSTMIDVYSRWAYAQPIVALRPGESLRTVMAAQRLAPFQFQCVQSDHGSEFSKYFTKGLETRGMRHRQIRVRKPNDNAHIERFNRTLQDECGGELRRYISKPIWFTRVLREYMLYYNMERIHLGLDGKTPDQMFPRS